MHGDTAGCGDGPCRVATLVSSLRRRGQAGRVPQGVLMIAREPDCRHFRPGSRIASYSCVPPSTVAGYVQTDGVARHRSRLELGELEPALSKLGPKTVEREDFFGRVHACALRLSRPELQQRLGEHQCRHCRHAVIAVAVKSAGCQPFTRASDRDPLGDRLSGWLGWNAAPAGNERKPRDRTHQVNSVESDEQRLEWSLAEVDRETQRAPGHQLVGQPPTLLGTDLKAGPGAPTGRPAR